MNVEVSERDIVYVCQLLTNELERELVWITIVNCVVAVEKIEEPNLGFNVVKLRNDVGFHIGAPERAWVL